MNWLLPRAIRGYDEEATRSLLDRAASALDQIARRSDAAMGSSFPVIEKNTTLENDSDLAIRTIGSARHDGNDLSQA